MTKEEAGPVDDGGGAKEAAIILRRKLAETRERLEKVEAALRTAKALASQHYDPSIDSEFAAMSEIDAALTGDTQEGRTMNTPEPTFCIWAVLSQKALQKILDNQKR